MPMAIFTRSKGWLHKVSIADLEVLRFALQIFLTPKNAQNVGILHASVKMEDYHGSHIAESDKEISES